MMDGWCRASRLSSMGLVMLTLACCSWIGGGHAKPDWIDGVSRAYPAEQYLVGVGQADNRAVAEDQAYAAVARIFKAEVNAQAKDFESYLVIEQRGQSTEQRRLALDNLTRVSTDKMLENVQILDRWVDLRKGLHYALAGMQRAQAETAILDRIRDLDRTVQEEVDQAHQATDKLARVRGLRRAAKNLVLRETYNADLRVIRPSGQGTAATYRVNDLTSELEQFLATNLVLVLSVGGDQSEPVQRALTEGLIREGLQVTSRPFGADGSVTTSPLGPSAELLIRGLVRVWPIDVQDPQFRYVRWCSDFEVLDLTTQKVVGALSKGGKEGHLTEREATAKVIRVMQQDMSSDVAKAIAAHVYGETELPAQAIPPAGCPREGQLPKPATATH